MVQATASVIFLFIQFTQAFAYAENTATTAVLHALAKSLRTVDLPMAGRGAAHYSRTVTTIPQANESSYVQFRFDGRSTRSELYAQKGDQNPAWEWFSTPDITVRHETEVLVIESASDMEPYRELGHDYHPDTFLVMRYVRFDYLLGRYVTLMKEAKDPGLTTIRHGTHDGHPCIHVVFDHTVPGYADKQEMTIDRIGSDYLPAAFKCHPRIPDRKMDWQVEWSIHWKKWDNALYPEEVRYRVTSYKEGRRIASEERIVINIESFQEVTRIDPEVFSVNSIDVPMGKRVIDHIAGIAYYKGQKRIEIRDLKEPLIRPGLLKK